MMRAPRITTGTSSRLRYWKPICPRLGRSLIGGAGLPSWRFRLVLLAEIHVLDDLVTDQPGPTPR
ncbi:MAG: hypothetical protein ACXU95_03245 [Isosphaeraceae bacterium]